MPKLERSELAKKRRKSTGGEDPDVTKWKKRLHLAEAKLKKKGGDPRGGEWKSLIRFFEGEQWSVSKGGKNWHKVTANQLKSNIDAIRPQLYFQNPKARIQIENPSLAPQDIPEIDPATGAPVIDPATGQPQIRITKGTPVAEINGELVEAQQQVDLIEAIDNYYLVKMNVKPKFRRNINDALILPYAVGKLEWILKTEEFEEEYVDENGEIKTRKVERVVEQYPQYSRVKPWCFLWDTELDEFDLESASWVAEISYLSDEDIKKDPYLKVAESDLGTAASYDLDARAKDDDDQFSDESKEECRRKVYSIHDQKNNRLMVWIEGSNTFARDEENPYRSVAGTIYTVLGFDETIDDSFPIPIPRGIKSLAEAYNFIRSYAVNHASAANRKYKHVKGAFTDDAEKEKFETGADMSLIEVKAMNLGPEPIADAAVHQDNYAVGDILKREITEAIGVTSYSRGVREPGVDTAYEANLISAGGDVKVQEKRDIVREFVKTVVRKLNQILKTFADQKQVIQIVGLQGTRWVQWSAEDIRGEFLEDVDIYSSMPYSQLEERKQAMEFFSLAQQDPYMNPFKVRAKVARMMDWEADIVYTPAEFQQLMAQQQQAAAEPALDANAANQSSSLRPSEGEIRRRPDMVADIRGSARR